MKRKMIFLIVAVLLVLSLGTANAEVLPPGGGSGAIFTTTPDGTIVNENVHYAGRQYVYLDGGPKQNAPAKAAGLDEGFYVFQITDPPGKLLLSRDPARCRIVHVNAAGVIDKLMAPTDATVTDPDGNTVKFYTGAATNNWAESGKYSSEPCHVAGPLPDSNPGTYAPTPDITGVGRHDTNPDVDHFSDAGAIVVQMMPYGLTPNPGGVYKAWMTPIQAYKTVKGANLNAVPNKLPTNQKPHPCYDFCASADPGFVPSHRYTKTDNFKVTEKFPAEIKVRKFEDLNGNGIWDAGEPEIGVDKFINGGGWPYDFTEPLNGGTKTELFYTPGIHVAAFAGTYSAEEYYLDGWVQTASWLDGSYQVPFKKKVDVWVAATAPGETHEIRFGNFKLVDVTACKVEDKDGDLKTTGDQTAVPGWTVYLSIDGVRQTPGKLTGADGCYTWTGLGPGHSYDVEEDDPAPEWTALTPLKHDFGLATSGASYKFVFANFKNVDVKACKYEDMDGDGGKDKPIAGWTVYLTIKGEKVDKQVTGVNGCYIWENLGPLPAGSYYDVSEDVPYGWTATSPTEVDFEHPQSGASYLGEFTNFKNVKVTACKYEDMDGDGGKDKPIAGWTVNLTVKDVIKDTQKTGVNGCYTWENLGPLPAGSYYDVSEEVPYGWTATSPTEVDFESPPQSGASYLGEFTNFKNVKVTACKYEDKDGDGGKDKPIAGWTVNLTVDDVIKDTQKTGEDGCYTWENLGPLPAGSYYDVSEEVPYGWTATSPTEVDFESPPQSGASYLGEFTNFKNVEVKACKVKDLDGYLATSDDRYPVAGWTVVLTRNDEFVDKQLTGEDGCYTWSNLPPVPGGWYDVHESIPDGWLALTPASWVFKPIESGGVYKFTFINTPLKGCTPGFWQGGNEFGTAGGKWYWDTMPDPNWAGLYAQPYFWYTGFCSFFGCVGNTETMWHFINPDTWEVNDDFHKAARSMVAAYLNASWGIAYAYSLAELDQMWDDSYPNYLYALHLKLDKANNAVGGCPISASIP